MKIKRYITFFTGVVALLVLMSFIMNDFKGIYIEMFLDLNAFIMITIIPVLVTLTKYDIAEIATHIITAFSTKKLNVETYMRANDFYKFQGLVYIYTGILICLFSVMLMLRDLSIEFIGKCLGTALCGFIYSILVILLYVLPVRMSLKDKV